MSDVLRIEVLGIPRPQGSVTAWRDPQGRSRVKYPETVHQWRGAVSEAAVKEMRVWPHGRFSGPVAIRAFFDLPRPKAHYGTGRNEGTVKPSAPKYAVKGGDLDKYLRAINDALTDAGVWGDDSQVVLIESAKRYVGEDDLPGAVIDVWDIADA